MHLKEKEAKLNTNEDLIDILDSFWSENGVSNENTTSEASKIKAKVCAVTHKGCVKKTNGDNYSLNGRTTADGGLQKETVYVQEMSEPFHLCVCDGTFSGEV